MHDLLGGLVRRVLALTIAALILFLAVQLLLGGQSEPIPQLG